MKGEKTLSVSKADETNFSLLTSHYSQNGIFMSENLKKLTGKFGFEPVVKHLINDCDTALFKELVENDSFLFDFVKQNVANRIGLQINETNYKNLLEFLKFYSPSYEDVIVSALVKYADEDLTDFMLEKFENGSDEEKNYAAKYFAYVQDPLAYNLLRKNSYCENEFLAQNCAFALAMWKDLDSLSEALEKLKSEDDFEKLSAVKFLSAYGNKDVIPQIYAAMKTSAMAENIAGEIPYIENLFDLLDKYYEDTLFVINLIINGLGEILPLSVVFDFELFDVFERLIGLEDSKAAVVLLNAREKFEILTENDEYLFDEDKDTKNEVNDIKNLLKSTNKKELEKYINAELNENSLFVYTALDFTTDLIAIRELLKSDNQTVILKTAEVLKKFNKLDETAKTVALLKVSDINIKSIIRAL